MSAPTDPESVAILESLRRAVANALERKRRLQQYAVIWMDGGPVCIGPDAPTPEAPSTTGSAPASSPSDH